MKRIAGAVLVGLWAVAAVAPVHADSGKNLYLVKGVQNVNGVYVGDFVALRKQGQRIVGAVGAFGSEYMCIKGTVADGRLRAKVYENGQPVASFNRAWRGSGATQRIKGMTRVPRAEVVTYLEGGDPVSFIRQCRADIG